jgi:hypothetical protein
MPSALEGLSLARNLAQPRASETDLAQRDAIAERGGKPLEFIARAEQHTQLVKPADVIGQIGQRTAAQIENLDCVSETEHFARKFGEPVQAQLSCVGEIAAAKGLQVGQF